MILLTEDDAFVIAAARRVEDESTKTKIGVFAAMLLLVVLKLKKPLPSATVVEAMLVVVPTISFIVGPLVTAVEPSSLYTVPEIVRSAACAACEDSKKKNRQLKSSPKTWWDRDQNRGCTMLANMKLYEDNSSGLEANELLVG